MEEEIVQNSDTISNVNVTAERNSAQITSVSETRIADNIQTISDIENIKDKIVENSNTISEVNSTLSSQLSLTNNNVLNNEMKIKQMDSTMTLFSQDLDKNKDDVEKELKKIQLTPGPRGEAGPQGPQGERGKLDQEETAVVVGILKRIRQDFKASYLRCEHYEEVFERWFECLEMVVVICLVSWLNVFGQIDTH